MHVLSCYKCSKRFRILGAEELFSTCSLVNGQIRYCTTRVNSDIPTKVGQAVSLLRKFRLQEAVEVQRTGSKDRGKDFIGFSLAVLEAIVLPDEAFTVTCNSYDARKV